MTAPSAWQVEQAMSAWLSARARMMAEDNDEAAIGDLLTAPDGDVKDIIGRLIQAAQHASALADAAGSMIDSLTARRDRFKRRADTMRSTIFQIMDAMGERKIELPHGTASLSTGRQTALITDEAAIPDRFVKIVTERKIDKAELLAALKDGEVIEGATLTNSMPSLTLRSK